MSDFTGIIVVIVSIVCMIMAQRKATPKPQRGVFSLLGGMASAMIAVEAARRGEPGVATLFALAAATSLLILALEYLKPTKPGA